jgi:hypothetical protein
MRAALALLVALCLAAPAAAEETLTALGDRWYRLEIAPVQIPPSGQTGRIIICLDDIPGGIDGTPAVNVKPIDATKESVDARQVGFFPLRAGLEDDDEGAGMPYVTVVLRGMPGSWHRVKVLVRGKAEQGDGSYRH